MKKFSAPGRAPVTALSFAACAPAATTEASAPAELRTIVEVAVANFKTLVAAVKVADTDSVHFCNIQKDAGCSSNSRNPYWVVLVPLGKIP